MATYEAPSLKDLEQIFGRETGPKLYLLLKSLDPDQALTACSDVLGARRVEHIRITGRNCNLSCEFDYCDFEDDEADTIAFDLVNQRFVVIKIAEIMQHARRALG